MEQKKTTQQESEPVNNLQDHTHDGINTQRLYPKYFYGYPIYTAVPTYKADEGTFTTANFGGKVYVYLMMNKVWNLVGISPASISNTVSLNFGNIAPNTAADLTMALTGAVIGDPVILGVDDAVISTGTLCADITFFAWVSASDVITVRCLNGSAVNTANPAAGNFTSKIMNL